MTVSIRRVFRVSMLTTHLALALLGIAVVVNGLLSDRSGSGEDWSALVGFVIILAVPMSAVILLPLALVVRRSTSPARSAVAPPRVLWAVLVAYLMLPLMGIWWLGFAYLFIAPAVVALVLVIALSINTSKSERNIQ